jgi:predicted DNA-binding transcriptional regulator AlpA
VTKKAISHAPSVTAQVHLSPDLDRVLTENEAAEFLGLSKDSLRREFRAGRAPPRVRLSLRRIGYRLSDIHRFLEQRLEQPAPPVRR